MDNLKELPTERLLEMLAAYTLDYTHLVRNGCTNVEITSCEIVLTHLQTELQERRQSISDTDFQFNSNISEQ